MALALIAATGLHAYDLNVPANQVPDAALIDPAPEPVVNPAPAPGQEVDAAQRLAELEEVLLRAGLDLDATEPGSAAEQRAQVIYRQASVQSAAFKASQNQETARLAELAALLAEAEESVNGLAARYLGQEPTLAVWAELSGVYALAMTAEMDYDQELEDFLEEPQPLPRPVQS
jgi:hypothetical protein